MEDTAVRLGGKKRTRARFALLCAAAGACIMAICSQSSFLYPMNTWDDVHCFCTVGRAIRHGQVLYRDIYEQKGPLLYFIYALVTAVSPRSFWGMYIMESACFAAFLYYSGQCAQLYTDCEENIWYKASIVLPAGTAVAVSMAFCQGGSVEEMFLFPVAFSLYKVLGAVRERRPVSGRDAFWIGLFASAAFWVKYTLCGFYGGLALFTAIYYGACLRDGKGLLRTIGWFMLGLVPVTAVVLGYFAIHGALKDLWEVYFYNNLFIYSEMEDRTLTDELRRVWLATRQAYENNRLYMTMTAAGLLMFAKDALSRPWEALAAVLSFLVMTVCIFFGGQNFFYYGLYLASYAVFGMIGLARLVRWAVKKSGAVFSVPGWGKACLCAVLGAGLLFFAYETSDNAALIGTEKQDLVQYRFGEIIRQEEDPTMLDMGYLDEGFYFAAGIDNVPKYFAKLNIFLPEMYFQRNLYIARGEVDFVVTTGMEPQLFLDTFPLYELVSDESPYCLFRLRR